MKEAKRRREGQWGLIMAVLAALIGGSTIFTAAVSWEALTSGKILTNLFSIVGEMFPPDPAIVGKLPKPIGETLAMSVMATLLAVLLSLPLAFLGAKTTCRSTAVRWAVKAVINALRTIPELIMAIIFVAAVGFGILPGILALGLHSVGMLGKFYAEAIERVDLGAIEAVEAVGGSRFHVILFGVIPQIITQVVDFTLYRWEYNFRASTVVGMVGAGGIGFELVSSLRLMQYQEVLAILIVVFGLVQLVDSFGNLIREKMLGKEEG
ncbi:phosphonate transport system permease protein [Dendrosporobacter quercicolus]|uniref:Phosphonate transport system permease protein n=1 Tax=Dendrosporobacter quercicolus TaxID=146817 RepID=A0A1G9YCY2_9FIRM|nr:phosphonate ABC transporter, permease protein PhnE [Dendrosporobacter quercicolus]SDN06355.1 phosphonate transport system permease protein [Dendrosporobacter quercicolus]